MLVKWSACSPSTSTIWVRFPLVYGFFCKLFENNENKQKVAGDGSFKKINYRPCLIKIIFSPFHLLRSRLRNRFSSSKCPRDEDEWNDRAEEQGGPVDETGVVVPEDVAAAVAAAVAKRASDRTLNFGKKTSASKMNPKNETFITINLNCSLYYFSKQIQECEEAQNETLNYHEKTSSANWNCTKWFFC